jgi:DNA-binding PadR family transcriptional regulator
MLVEQPRHPYEIQRLIRERHKDFAAGNPRALYHAVDMLAKAGAIEPAETSREGKRPERTVYRITDEGREELRSWLAELIESPRSEYPEFTAALSFLGCLEIEEAIGALHGREVVLAGQIASIDAALKLIQERRPLPRLLLVEVEFTRAMRQAELAWVQALIDDMRSGRLTWNHAEFARQMEEQIARSTKPTELVQKFLDGEKGERPHG